jgi:hypothetical protein
MATEVEAQIAGNVWKIERSVGDRVDEEEVILIIESMKTPWRRLARGGSPSCAWSKATPSRKARSSR